MFKNERPYNLRLQGKHVSSETPCRVEEVTISFFFFFFIVSRFHFLELFSLDFLRKLQQQQLLLSSGRVEKEGGHSV